MAKAAPARQKYSIPLNNRSWSEDDRIRFSHLTMEEKNEWALCSYGQAEPDPLPYIPEARARTEDPPTAVLAACTLTKERTKELFTQILDALEESGPLTMWECCRASGIELQSGSPRFAQMRRLGLIEEHGYRRNPSGKLAIAWIRKNSSNE